MGVLVDITFNSEVPLSDWLLCYCSPEFGNHCTGSPLAERCFAARVSFSAGFLRVFYAWRQTTVEVCSGHKLDLLPGIVAMEMISMIPDPFKSVTLVR